VRRSVLSIAFLLVWLSGWSGPAPRSWAGPPKEDAATAPPNAILIVLDAARADHLSAYGYERSTTRNLDRLATEGALYEWCFTPSSWTLPSLTSLFTGLFPEEHGVDENQLHLRRSISTAAERFSEAGYATVGFSNNAWVGDFSGLARGFDEFHDVWRGLERSSPDFGAAVTNEWILEWLDSINENQPFFLFALYFEPHFPYRPPDPFHRRFLRPDIDDSVLFRVRNWSHPRELGYILKVPGMEISDEEMETLVAQYDGELAYLDFKLGELFAELESRGILDNSVVVVTADHGEHLGEQELLDHKMTLYDPAIRVPLILRFPPAVGPDTRIDALVQTVDILPTLLNLCGLDWDREATRRLPLSPEEKGREYVKAGFARPTMFLDVIRERFPEADYQPFDRALKTVRTQDHKLIWASDGRHELYDVRRDPGETVNLYSERPELAERLLRLLEP
jgi:arylsulfatase A-like enzyme